MCEDCRYALREMDTYPCCMCEDFSEWCSVCGNFDEMEETAWHQILMIFCWSTLFWGASLGFVIVWCLSTSFSFP
jgi:hypothetical protein